MSKEAFKTFVRDNPSLVNYVKNNEMTWQKFYEMYDLYGSDNEIWQKYLKSTTSSSGILNSNLTLKEIIAMAKGFDLAAVQKGLSSLERAVEVIRDVTVKNVTGEDLTRNNNNYEPRPMYKYFED